MGIETLIIFIAMILVSAVAAGVLLKTVGALQQRSLAVGNEARERLSTGIEVTQVTANTNLTANSFHEIEVLYRLQPGSYDIQLITMSMTINTQNYFHTARLMNREAIVYYVYNVTYIDNDTWIEIGNLDTDDIDIENDEVRLIYNVSGVIDALQFNLSTAGYVNVSLGADVEGNSTIAISELPIRAIGDGTYDMHYGFINLNGTLNTGKTINTSNVSLTFTIESDVNTCSWDLLIPNYRFCNVPKVGDTDTVVEPGELLDVRYKLDYVSALGRDTTFDINFIPKGGRVIYLLIYTPQVFSRRVLQLWP
jgi:archaellin